MQIRQIESEGCLLELNHYTFSYPNCIHPIIDDFTFKLYSQDRIGISGKNGVGKSTLLRSPTPYFLELCERFDLPEDFLNRPIDTFSSGEKKKLDLVRCICSESHILIMDEPLNYMDVNFREQLTKAILEKNLTLVFVEHDEMFLKEVATRIIQM